MSESRCRACGGTDTELQLAVADRRIRRCRACSHRFLERRYDESMLTEFYANYADSSESEGGVGPYFTGGQEELRANLRDYLQRTLALLGERHDGAPAPRLLDVGCGSGTLLTEAKDLGFGVEGIDLAPGLAAHVRSTLDCPVHEGFLPSLDLPAESFDVVTMYDLIEHVEDPPVDLAAVLRILRPGGVLMLLTPNEHALVRALAKAAHAASMGRWERPLAALYHDQHLSYFTARSLSRALSVSGFELRALTRRDPEIGRLYLQGLERVAVQLSFLVTAAIPPLRTKLLAWASKPAS